MAADITKTHVDVEPGFTFDRVPGDGQGLHASRDDPRQGPGAGTESRCACSSKASVVPARSPSTSPARGSHTRCTVPSGPPSVASR